MRMTFSRNRADYWGVPFLYSFYLVKSHRASHLGCVGALFVCPMANLPSQYLLLSLPVSLLRDTKANFECVCPFIVGPGLLLFLKCDS